MSNQHMPALGRLQEGASDVFGSGRQTKSALTLAFGLSRFVRRTMPRIYDRLVKFRASAAMHRLRNLPAVPINRWRMWRSHPYLLVDISEQMGLGANLTLAVRVLAHAEERGLRPVLRFSNPLYSPTGRTDTDWLPMLFDRRDPEQGVGFRLPQYLRRYWHVERHMRDAREDIPVGRSHDLLFGYMRIRSGLVDAADAFCRDNGISARTLAVHYRGTDKYLESPRVELDRIVGTIEEHAADYDNIFVATDEPEFLDQMRARFPAGAIKDLGCKWIFPNSQPVHLTPGNGIEKAQEALLTMLVLSRCGLCIRTPSNLSHWAQVLNPNLPAIVVQ